MTKKIKNYFSRIQCGDIKITSFPAIIKILTSMPKKGNIVQAVAKNPVYSKKHVLFALSHSINFFESKSNKLDNLSLDFLLKLCASKNLPFALKHAGLKPNSNQCMLVVTSKSKKQCKNDFLRLKKILNFKPKKFFSPDKQKIKQLFKISEKELKFFYGKKGLELLVLEKIALSLLD